MKTEIILIILGSIFVLNAIFIWWGARRYHRETMRIIRRAKKELRAPMNQKYN